MRVYSYGCRPPCTEAAAVDMQLRLSHNFQAEITAFAAKKWNAIEHLFRKARPVEHAAYVAAESAASQAAERVYLMRSTKAVKAPKGDEDAARDLKEAIKDLEAAREVEKEAFEAWRLARKAATPKLRPRLGMCSRGLYARQKKAYAEAGVAGLAWGTRLKIQEFVERAAESSAKHWHAPEVHEWEEDGILAVQLQNGLAFKDAIACKDTRFQLKIIKAAEWHQLQEHSGLGHDGKPLPAAKEGREKRFAVARIRIGSDGRSPIWADFPIKIHRFPADEALIKWAMVVKRRIGLRYEWDMQIIVEEDGPEIRTEDLTLAVNLGWRQMEDDTVRIGYVIGSDGYHEDVRVPTRVVEHITKAKSIASQATKNFEAAKESILRWTTDADVVPAWLSAMVENVQLWRNPGRFDNLLRVWEGNRFAGDEQMFDALMAWKKQHRHLRFWAADEETKARRMRKDIYRNTAAKWTEKYSHIVVTSIDLRDFSEIPNPEDGKKTAGSEQRRIKSLAAPSILRGAIKNAAIWKGSKFDEILESRDVGGKKKRKKGKPSAAPTQTCNKCGVRGSFDTRPNVMLKCLSCGEEFDQDANHCLNLLASAEAASKKPTPLAASVEGVGDKGKDEGKGRWGKRRSKKASKERESTEQLW